MKLLITIAWGQLLLVLCALDITEAFQQHTVSFRPSGIHVGYRCHPYKLQIKSFRHNSLTTPKRQLLRMKVSASLGVQDHSDNERTETSSSFTNDEIPIMGSVPSKKATDATSKEKKVQKNIRKVGIALTALLTSSWGLMVLSGEGAWRYYLSGGICAAISHAITTPIDVIKTRKQVDESMKDVSTIKAGLKIMREDGGVGGLLAGLGPTTVGYLMEGAVKFGIYEVLKPLVRSILIWCAAVSSMPWVDSKSLGFIISGGMAGIAASIMLCPMEALRIRIVAEQESQAGGWVGCFFNMISNEGVKGLWKSLPAMLSKQVPYTITKNVSFDLITKIAYGTVAGWGLVIGSRMKFVIPLLSAMLASILSCISSQPGDMLLSVVNAQQGKMTTRDFFNQITEEYGIKGLYVGMRERFLHVGLIVTTQLLIYDFVKRLVGIPATGL